MISAAPLVGILADRRQCGRRSWHRVDENYLAAVTGVAGAVPLLLPALGEKTDAAALLQPLSGLLLPGSASNVEPWRYQQGSAAIGVLHDPHRDAAAFALIREAIHQGVPLLAICRGFQELNVALGGSLHQALERLPGMIRHRMPSGDTLEQRYAPSHELRFASGGLLERISGRLLARVNSVHSQGIDRLADALIIEAVAPDGLVEAAVVRAAPGFTLGVQWHPEWKAQDNPLSIAIFKAFGEAVAARAASLEGTP